MQENCKIWNCSFCSFPVHSHGGKEILAPIIQICVLLSAVHYGIAFFRSAVMLYGIHDNSQTNRLQHLQEKEKERSPLFRDLMYSVGVPDISLCTYFSFSFALVFNISLYLSIFVCSSYIPISVSSSLFSFSVFFSADLSFILLRFTSCVKPLSPLISSTSLPCSTTPVPSLDEQDKYFLTAWRCVWVAHVNYALYTQTKWTNVTQEEVQLCRLEYRPTIN